jgi:hypothetical protein
MKADKGRKFRAGGLKEVDSDSNPGLSKLPTEVRNKMGYMKKANPFMEMIAKKKEAAAKKPAKTAAMPMRKGGAACAPKKMANGGKTMKKSGRGC